MITKLEPNQIFVFGSNLAGRHGAGAAAQARKQFGAEPGVGEGLTGQSYAFPTLDRPPSFNQLPLEWLIIIRDRFYSCAEANPHLEFLLTKVGCGLAGYPEEDMKALFDVPTPKNVIKPDGW